MADAGDHPSRPVTANCYYSQDFQWEDLRDEVEGSKDSKNMLIPSEGLHHQDDVESWVKFHARHAKNPFFKERRYLVKEFPELTASDRALRVLEIGCGTGSSVLPILRANKAVVVYACDCSESALRRAEDLVKSSIPPDGNGERFFPFLCDVSTERLPPWLRRCPCPSSMDKALKVVESSHQDDDMNLSKQCLKPLRGNVGGMDFVTMVFTLSSIPPQRMQHVIQECFAVLEPGGLVLFRDYGLYDMKMQRFSPAQKVGDRLYRRVDGTLSYFFSPDVLRGLFTHEGFVEEEISYCCVELRNRRKELPMKRVWIHAKFSKPTVS